MKLANKIKSLKNINSKYEIEEIHVYKKWQRKRFLRPPVEPIIVYAT